MTIPYIVIPLVTVFVAAAGGWLTSTSVKTWYVRLRKPAWTPSGRVIGTVWTVLYILACGAALLAWAHGASLPIKILFALNAALNVLWSAVFFYLRRPFAAIWVCLALDLTIVILIQLLPPVSLLASVLLVPYAAWVTFASYLNYRVWGMNR